MLGDDDNFMQELDVSQSSEHMGTSSTSIMACVTDEP
jgi:hypothetical protein